MTADKRVTPGADVRPIGDLLAQHIETMTACLKVGDFFGAGRVYAELEQRAAQAPELERTEVLVLLEHLRMGAKQAQSFIEQITRSMMEAHKRLIGVDQSGEVLCTKCRGSYLDHEAVVQGERIEWVCPTAKEVH